MNKIDLNSVWDETRAMGRANRDLLAAIAGMFILLPGMVADQLLVPAEAPDRSLPAGEAMNRLMEQVAANWPVLLGHALVTSFASLAMLILLLRPERPTVAESLKTALILLPGYFVANLLQGMAIGAGLVLLLVPGLYLVARFALIAPVVAAEGRNNPLEMIKRSIDLTRGNGWRIFAMLAILYVTASLVWMVMAVLVRIVASLLLSAELADLALSFTTGLLEAGFAVMVVLISAALYRAVAAPGTVATIFR